MNSPVGYRKSMMAYRVQYGHLIPILQRGLSLRDTAKACNLSINTIRKIKSILR
jgi:hypothetical protein